MFLVSPGGMILKNHSRSEMDDVLYTRSRTGRGLPRRRREDLWYRPDDATRIGRWREDMTALEQEIVGDILNALPRRLGDA
jgi:hypothetical protein